MTVSIERTIGKASKEAERRPNGQQANGRRFSLGFSLKFSIHSLMNTNGNTNGGAELKEKSIGFLEKRAQLPDSV